MRYRRPFTPEQRRDAAKVYESLRSHVRLLRKVFPPVNREQLRLFREYQHLVHAIGSELMKVDALVNVDEVNRLIRLSRGAATEYFRLLYFAE